MRQVALWPGGGANRGFTLTELMIAVAILAVMAMLMVPSPPSEKIADHRRGAELVREQFEFARAQAMATGLAHRVSIELESGEGFGAIRVFRGLTPQCQFNFGGDDALVRTLVLDNVSRIASGGGGGEGASSPSIYEVGAGDARLLTVLTMASLAAVQPAEALTDDICMRSDGTARNARFNVPFMAVDGGEAAGAVAVSVNNNITMGGATSAIGGSFKVIVPYSGVARVAF